MERLTIKNSDGSYSQPTDTTFYEIFNKLGELEDVLEKWNIEDLDKFLEEQIAKKRELNDILWKMEQELAELKQKAIVLPKELCIGCKIFWVNEYGIYSGKLCAVTKDINPNGGFNIWLCCLYDNGLSYSHLIKDFEVELFATREEAQQKFAEIRGEKDE